MLHIRGYTLRGAIKATGANLLFHAVRDADGLPLILKTPMASSPGPRERERYHREFAILQRLRDVGGVTRPHACERVHERPVLLLEEMEGTPLSELTGAPLEPARVLKLSISLASTLAELHRRGVVHKDIKPSNVILTPTGEACLLDFGTASLHLVEHVDAAPASLLEGTLAYMSPEQTGRMNRPVDYRTDFYSLGVMLYELLTGSRPFHGRDALEWFHAHLALVPPSPLERVPSLPPVLSAIVMKLLAKVAEERYQSADGLKADLERCQEGLLRGAHEDFPLGVHDFPSRFQLPQRLYGRAPHAAALLQGFERVARGGQPELLLVRGYSGIGKSSVVHELHKPVVRRRSFFLTGKFEQFQQDIPYATLAHAISGLTQQLLSGTDAELAAWRERLQAAWEGEGQLLVDVVPQLELIVGKQSAVLELPAVEAQNRFNRVFRKFLGVFATSEHPLVLFLDDLQWADGASLQLIKHLLTHPETPPVLLIGAYRDNEVSPSHPLVHSLEELRKAGVQLTELQLEPLRMEELQQLVADTLPGADEGLIQPLSALVLEKTGGNPFFVLQFMRTLHQDGLLVRTPQGTWRWDAEGVREKGYSDNVVEFMVGKLRQLPRETQHLLRLAACVGNTFDVTMLARISEHYEPGAAEQGLEPALQEGLLVRAGPEQYRFLHDRIQQAAHVLIPEQERKAIHLRIGRLLLASLSAEQVHEKLFDVVSQLNAGAELIREPEDRRRAARLNADAGARARTATAFRSAAAYFAAAFQHLSEDPWGLDSELAFKVRLEQARCEFMSGNIADARRLVLELLPRARTRPELAAVHRLKSELYIMANEVQAAAVCLLECLARMGMPMPLHPTWEEVEKANAEVWALLGERPISSFIELPMVDAPDLEALMSVLSALFAPAYYTSPQLLILHLSRMVSLSLTLGHTPASVHGYSWYAMVVGTTFKKYREGQALCELACELVERYDLVELRGKALLTRMLVNCWTQPLPVALELGRGAFQHALQSGDIQSACFASSHRVTNRLALGQPLEEVYQESVACLDFASKVGFLGVRDVILFTQAYVQQLRGLTPSFGSLNGEGFDEASFEVGAASNQSTTVCWYWLTLARARFLSGAYSEALEAVNKGAELSWASIGQLPLLDLHLFGALSLAACYGGMPPEKQGAALEAIRGHQRQLAEWADHCPSTFLAPERLVSAELARLTGQEGEALRAYERALQSAREHGFVQTAALVCELAARFWRERDVPTLAEAYARKARDAYVLWGAHGKVKHLDTEWPLLASAEGSEASDTGSTQLDALTLVKAQQAISGEIVLERLATTLLSVAIENAGAQRGALLVPQGDSLQIVALSGIAPESSTSCSDGTHLPWSLLSYVKRTREHVLIGDASQPHPFSADPWLAHGRARSVLCLPLLRQEEFRGVLYLENDAAPDAFTPARLSLLGHLASQAAISVENARLYADVKRAKIALCCANDELEKRVEERTRELKQAQARLVDTARSAGMAEVAANVLHNVGNVLTSAVINHQVLRQTVNSSRVGRLKQSTTLLAEHRDSLADFLTRDPRGTQLLDYLGVLSDELLCEQATLREGMDAMGMHIDHIRAIVQIQQNYANNTLITEECELSGLVQDALGILMPALRRHGVTVIQELAALPPVRLDKHKVLQILINLISNAKKAVKPMPEGQRHVLVRLEAVGRTARIQVVDNGVGIAPENLERIFVQGFTTREGGHGLGLHSSALAAKTFGGSLSLESDGPGKGATAILALPLDTGTDTLD
ncbi:trifunctional serine/threonine-protein kinase/ATP-binding protein/sensor histidine kinase [Archangium lansingense]|uniref:histidine kinase n=1 Tax=Archangium lansingense TaxID=2995310 RepID=A0ABT4A7D3_9BACT|nr:AAA family ATPase [Archangium lansinium]MCY1077579.1 AAA family ATPase [Archangium lansinium]